MRTLLFLALVGCTTTTQAPSSQGGARGLRASDHLAQAREHDQLARDRNTWPTTQVATPGSPEVGVPMPWLRTHDTADEHKRVARTHRSQAAALQARYDEACADRSGTDVTVSPLTRFGGAAWNTPTGVVVHLDASAGPPTELLRALRCHSAWMMLSPTPDDESALDLPGLVLDVRNENGGITLSMTVTDPKLLPELQRRVTKHLETRRTARRP